MRVIGLDACPGGWVGVRLDGGAFSRACLGSSLEYLLGTADAQVAAVDMPLGLLDSGWRQADPLAAKLVGPLRSSVFRVPPRSVWQEASFEAANRLCRELTGVGMTRQAWGLQRKLLEANACREEGAHPLYEVHPEVSFRAMAGQPLEHGKKTWAGQALRRALLVDAGILLPDDLGEANRAPSDDVLDAAAAAWSAQRIATGQALTLPERPEVDGHDRPIAIWY